MQQTQIDQEGQSPGRLAQRPHHRISAAQAALQLLRVSRNLLKSANGGQRENLGGSPAGSIEAALESLVFGATEGGPPCWYKPCSPHRVTG